MGIYKTVGCFIVILAVYLLINFKFTEERQASTAYIPGELIIQKDPERLIVVSDKVKLLNIVGFQIRQSTKECELSLEGLNCGLYILVSDDRTTELLKIL